MATQLTDIASVENYTLQDISDSFESQVESWIDAVSAMLEQMTNRVLVTDEASVTRYYDGKDRTFIALEHDWQTITAVELGDVYGENFSAVTGYVKYPAVAPFRKLILKSGYFTKGIQNVKVTGTIGYLAAVPEDLKFAATVLVAGIINSHNPNAQTKKQESIGNYSVVYTDDKGITDYNRAMQIVDTYKKHLL